MPLLAEQRGNLWGFQLSAPSSLPFLSVSASPPQLYLLPLSFLPSSPLCFLSATV